jgi:predicted ferric reductase
MTLSKYLIEPALFGKIHLERFPWNLGYVPSRALSVLILAYVALNAVLCAINYPTIKPDTWYLSSNKQKISFIADRLGILSLANISLAIMFSGRNTPLLWITGRSRTEVLTFHRWVARVAAVQGIVHVVLYWSNTNSSGYNMFTLSAGIHTIRFDNNYWTYGIIAVIALGGMVSVLSMLPVRVAWYELFLVAHIIAAIVILFCLWQHVDLRYHKSYGYEVWLYIAFAIWGFERVVRPLRILSLNWKSWFCRNHPSAVVELLPGDEFVKVTVFPSIIWHFNAGQHCFLYFPTTSKNPFQSHPFSIASWSDGTNLTRQPPQAAASSTSLADSTSLEGILKDLPDPDSGPRPENAIELQTLETANHQMPNSGPSAPNKPSISFIIRPGTGLTRSLQNRLLKRSKMTMSAVFIEGPYGSADAASLRKADTIVAVAGGIGITCILGYLNLYLTSLCAIPPDDETAVPRKRGRSSRFVLFWSAREESLITAIKSQLADAEELRRKGVEVNIVSTGEADDGQSAERLDISEVIRGELGSERNTGRNVCVVSCGPGGMADVVRAAVVRNIGKNGVDVGLIEDVFAW